MNKNTFLIGPMVLSIVFVTMAAASGNYDIEASPPQKKASEPTKGLPDPCSLIKKAEAESFMGPIQELQSSEGLGYLSPTKVVEGKECEFTGKGELVVQVGLYPGTEFESFKKFFSPKAEPLSGFGDEAFVVVVPILAIHVEIWVRKGGTTLQVLVSDEFNEKEREELNKRFLQEGRTDIPAGMLKRHLDMAKRLAEKALGRLP